MSVTTESRSAYVVEPDAKLRVTATRTHDGDVMCTVELRRGISETLTVTIRGCELLRLAHDAVWIEERAEHTNNR